MPSQGPIANESVSASNLALAGETYQWTILDPSPGGDAAFGVTGGGLVDREYSVKLLVGSAAVGAEQATGTEFVNGDNPITYGGASSTFGASPTAAQVNAAGFGIVIAVQLGLGTEQSDYLAIPFPGFSIPVGATIDGIEFDIVYLYNAGSQSIQVYSDTSTCTVYYTEASGITGSASITQASQAVSAAGTVSVNGAASITQAGDTVSAAGSVSSASASASAVAAAGGNSLGRSGPGAGFGI